MDGSPDLSQNADGTYPNPPEGMALVQMPPDPKHFENPFWYDTFGVDLIDQRHLFSKEAGEQVTEVMKLLEEHPKQGQNMLVKAAAESNEEVLKALLAHGV